MELKKVDGCIAFSLTVDGVEEIDLNDEKRKEVLMKIGQYISNLPTDDLNCYLSHFIDYFGDEKLISSEPCECCGDWIYETKIEI